MLISVCQLAQLFMLVIIAHTFSLLADIDIVLLHITGAFLLILFIVSLFCANKPDEIVKQIAVNKIDESKQNLVEAKVLEWREKVPKAFVLPISALHEFNIQQLLDVLLHLLPESPAYYPKDELTDKTMRFFVSEIIREKILLNYKKEVPYSAEVAVEDYKEDNERIHIRAIIYVMRETQKGIILGHRGSMIKKTGSEARKDIEEFVDKHVYLDLTVKVSKDWRENETNLKRFGYK